MFDTLIPGKAYHQNLGSVKLSKNRKVFTVEYRGNMGSSISNSVDPMLASLGLPTVAKLKELGKEWTEKGSPDYQWELRVVIFR
tara:strand:+ start:870 stop:1121 length:252 start_codon:yes stop_codon:yes gene_type:complete